MGESVRELAKVAHRLAGYARDMMREAFNALGNLHDFLYEQRVAGNRIMDPSWETRIGEWMCFLHFLMNRVGTLMKVIERAYLGTEVSEP